MVALALKVLLAPALVVAATLAGRRWGDRVSGIVIALPVVAGPVLLVLAIEQGHRFVERAACGALIGIVAVGAFCVAFTQAARHGVAAAVAAGWTAYAICAVPLSTLAPGPLAGAAVAAAAILATRAVLTRGGSDTTTSVALSRPAWDLPARAAVTCALVVALTSAASALGPALSGVLTPFPVATTVLAGFTLSQAGTESARRALLGYVAGLPGFAAFFVLVAIVAR